MQTGAGIPDLGTGHEWRAVQKTGGRGRPAGAGDLIEPEGPTQVALAQIWSELLGIKNVGATDDFFDLGGDSLAAVTLFLRIAEEFGSELPLATITQHSTLRSLAARIDTMAASMT